jgi:hypothetical protein
MIRLFLLLGVLALSACDLPTSYARPPEANPPEKAPEPGVRVSGYARVGVSHNF